MIKKSKKKSSKKKTTKNTSKKEKAPAYLKRKDTVVLVGGDDHAPFHREERLDFYADMKREHKPTHFIHLGDEMDMHSLSFHDHDPDGMSQNEEFEAAMKKFMKPLYKIFPKAMVCISNHTARPFRRAFKYGISTRFLRDYKDFMEAPEGWNWQERWVIDGVQYIHGEGFSGKNGHINAAERHRQSTVIGHIHAHAGIRYMASETDLIFAMNCGWGGDNEAYAFRYGRHFPQKGICGMGKVINGKEAHFLPMDLGTKVKRLASKPKDSIKDRVRANKPVLTRVKNVQKSDLIKLTRYQIKKKLDDISEILPVNYKVKDTKEELIAKFFFAKKVILKRYG